MPRAKTALVTTLVILTNVTGNALLNAGVKGAGMAVIAAGVALLIIWTLSRMALLSWADLTWVLPVTSAGYVLNAAAGRIFFHEAVSPERWLGALCVTAGAVLVGMKER